MKSKRKDTTKSFTLLMQIWAGDKTEVLSFPKDGTKGGVKHPG